MNVLIAGKTSEICDSIAGLLIELDCDNISTFTSGAIVRGVDISRFDSVIISTPLSDEFGLDLVADIAKDAKKRRSGACQARDCRRGAEKDTVYRCIRSPKTLQQGYAYTDNKACRGGSYRNGKAGGGKPPAVTAVVRYEDSKPCKVNAYAVSESDGGTGAQAYSKAGNGSEKDAKSRCGGSIKDVSKHKGRRINGERRVYALRSLIFKAVICGRQGRQAWAADLLTSSSNAIFIH